MYYRFDPFQGVGMSSSDALAAAVAFDIRVKNYVQEEKEKERVVEEEEEGTPNKCDNGDVDLKMPSLPPGEVEEENDGFRTPTSAEHKIPVPLQCPPAPRKPKSLPLSRKRKACSMIRDLSREMDVLFPPPRVVVKIKKARGYTK